MTFFQLEGRCSNYFYQPYKSEGTSGSTELIYDMPVTRGGIRWFQSFPSHMHTYMHTSSQKNFWKGVL